MTDLLTRLLH